MSSFFYLSFFLQSNTKHSRSICMSLYNGSLCLATATVWRRSRVTGSGCVWSGPIKMAHYWPAALMTRRCACGWWPPRSARRSCGSTSMWWSAFPGPLRAHIPPFPRLQVLRYILLVDVSLIFPFLHHHDPLEWYIYSFINSLLCSSRTIRVESLGHSCYPDPETRPLKCGT